jgi:hypothetical protein
LKKGRLKALTMAALLAAGGAYALASIDWCRVPVPAVPVVVNRVSGQGALSAGAAKVELQPAFPATLAGYGPPRSRASSAEVPLYARALVVQVGKARLGWVTLDVLLVTDEVTQAIRQDAKLDEVWVAATHTHSSFGGYDPRPMAQLSGTGAFRARDRELVVNGAVSALRLASKALRPAAVSHGEGVLGTQVVARSGETVDPTVRVTRFRDSEGPVGQLVMLSAHPTLVPRRHEALHPDYPGLVAASEEAQAGITLVMQSAGGNAKVAAEVKSPEAFAKVVSGVLSGLKFSEGRSEVSLQASRVLLGLPPLDAARLVPSFTRVPAQNFMCLSATFEAEVHAVRLGDLVWWSAPFELSSASAREVGRADPSAVSVSLVGGYFGYLEPGAVVTARSGESVRQYFPPGLGEAVGTAVSLAVRSLDGPNL